MAPRSLVPVALGLAVSCGGTADPGDSSAPTEERTDTIDSGETVSDEPCSPQVGVTSPLEACTAAAPCDRTSDGSVLDSPSEVPTCAADHADRPAYDDGPVQRAVGLDGHTRYWCRTPQRSGARPLVLWFHGAGGSADDVYGWTSLRTKAEDAVLSTDGPSGFVLVSIQGRNLHWPTQDPRDMSHHDVYHRDLSSSSANADVALADALVDELVTSGEVDPERIYAMGWSNGGFFAQLYGFARHDTPTPGGHRVAAVAAYTAADPFADTRADDDLACELDPYPDPTVPIHLTTRSCDLIPCDQAQADAFLEEGYIVAPGAVVEPWSEWLAEALASDHEWLLVDGYGQRDTSCTSASWCPLWAASVNHLRWPDGIGDGSGNDYEEDMLGFLSRFATR